MLHKIYLDTGQFDVKLNLDERFVAVSAVPVNAPVNPPAVTAPVP
jgi:hypothetical protein